MANEADVISLISLGIALFTLILLLIIFIRHQRLLKRYRLLLNGPSGNDLDQILVQQAEQIESLASQLTIAQDKLQALAEASRRHLSRVGIVRFNPFPEMGSDLSFAVALLDEHDNGVVISSLYSRQESRVYAKPIAAGKSTYTLTDEEKEALRIARQ